MRYLKFNFGNSDFSIRPFTELTVST